MSRWALWLLRSLLILILLALLVYTILFLRANNQYERDLEEWRRKNLAPGEPPQRIDQQPTEVLAPKP